MNEEQRNYRLVGDGAAELQGLSVANLQVLRPPLADNADPFVGNATLRHEEWLRVDERVNEVLRSRLTVADDLRAAGLVEPITLGTILRRTERLEDFDDADLNFDGETAPKMDRPSYLTDTIPVPVISKGFKINWRQLDASRNRGEPLDTTAATVAARKVRDKIQALICNGLAAGGPGGETIPGLTTAASRLTATLSHNWNTAAGVPVDDVEGMLDTAYNSNLWGPFGLYVPKGYWSTLQQDYSANKGDNTIIQRILAFEDIQFVRPLDALTAHNVVMVQMTREVIDLSVAQEVMTVQWNKDPFVTHFRVLAVLGPHIKKVETEAGATVHGIVHLS